MSIESSTGVSNKVIILANRTCFLAAPQQSILGGRLKRAIDVAAAVLLLVWFSPILIGIAVLIKLCSHGPVIYRHQRIGMNSRPFPCFKFRTMVVNGDDVLRRHLAASPEAAREWAEKRKLRSDPRITAVGAVLRKSSLDELPQLLNVLRGEMSLVGPRPIVADEIRFYGQDIVHYFRARPGLTGAWQISGRSDLSYAERVALDRDYVENWSLWRDIVILLRTIPAVLTSRGTC